uniref:Amino acid transporter transmembrane domain-containing protein n=1 Tax=Romanomermis culicivorax TaxID=13658 RepID=A0A915JD78_ROMCU
MLGTFYDMDACKNKVQFPGVTLKGFISAYCTICFAYGGHSAFPTIQHDMKKPAKFPVSVLVSFASLFILYFPMPVLAYGVYGHTTQGTIEVNLSTVWIQDLIMILITGHVLFAFFIVISPVTQDLERVLKVPLRKKK